MLNSYVFYGLLIIYCMSLIALSFNSRETIKVKYVFLFFIVILATLIAFRPLDISDAYPYYARYHIEPAGTTISKILSEKSFYRGTGYSMSKPVNLLFYICYNMKMPYVFLVLMVASIELLICNVYSKKILVSEGIKYNEFLLLAMFIVFYSFRYQFIAFAQGIAMSIGIPLLYYLREKKYLKALLCLLLAVSIHIGALYFFPFVLVYFLFTRIKQKNIVFTLVWGLSGLFEFTRMGNRAGNYFVFAAKIIINRITASNEIYEGYANAGDGIIAFSLINFLFWLLCGIFALAYCKNDLYWRLLNNLVVAIFVSSILGRWGIVHRFTDISKMFTPILMIIYLYKAKPIFKIQHSEILLPGLVLGFGIMHGFSLLGA